MAVGAISPALKAPSTTSDDDEKQELQRTTSQAVDEGHDADIPSSAGYILDDKGEQKRRRSLASRRASCASRSQAHRDLEQGQEAEAEEEDDANVVWWDGPNDPENPYNWPAWKKVLNCGLISAMTFISPLGSCEFKFILDWHFPFATDWPKPSLPPASPRLCESSTQGR